MENPKLRRLDMNFAQKSVGAKSLFWNGAEDASRTCAISLRDVGSASARSKLIKLIS